MAVAPAELIQPDGELEAAWFPGEDEQTLEKRLETYLAEGAALSEEATDPDAATKAFGYWRAYEAVYLRLSGSPASVGVVGHMNRQYTQEQLRAFRAKAAEWRATFEGHVHGASESSGGNPPASRQTSAVFTW